ncbi:MAG: alpha/beta hydrolase [Micropruina sp.]
MTALTAIPRKVLAAALGLALLLAGCTGPTSPTNPPGLPPAITLPGEQVVISTDPGPAIDRPGLGASTALPAGAVEAPPGEGLAAYLEQKVTWTSCGEFDCAEIAVPLDYANPGEQAITLSMARRPASRTPKLGTLFINPGGPGASGKALLGGFAKRGLEQYDIVGWDPRGTGDSTPVRCFGPAETDELNALDASPDNDTEIDAAIMGSYEFGQSCWENSGALLEHISTIDTVRDLDLLRELAGDDTLRYLGYSYGTDIGATYAELFPHRVGRLVLDAAVDITDDDTVIQAMGFDLALGNFATWCAGQNCQLGSSKAEVLSTITDLLDELDADPLTVEDRVLTQTLATVGIAAYLYGGVPAWQALARDIDAATRGNGARLLSASDSLNDRNQDGSYGSLYYSFLAISCRDYVDDGVTDALNTWAEDQKKAPIFGKYFGPSFTCPLWPVRPQLQLDIRGRGAAPILVVGATGDPATPYQNAVTMAERLESGVLVTYQGEGHGTFGGKSSCVDQLVIAYLTKGTVPADGVRCS